MGMQERWQSRQGELTAKNEARDAEDVQRREAVVEAAESAIVAAADAFGRGDGWFEAEVEQRGTSGWSVYGLAAVDFGGPAPTRAGSPGQGREGHRRGVTCCRGSRMRAGPCTPPSTSTCTSARSPDPAGSCRESG